jgi:hypothetical protein
LLIPKLERTLGPHHRAIHMARRAAEKHRAKDREAMRAAIQAMGAYIADTHRSRQDEQNSH